MTNSTKTNRPETASDRNGRPSRPPIRITSRWNSGRVPPKLVTFSWGATTPSTRR